ncbi:FimV/HubP family polar landmark protein [Paraburkholderia flava]|uniref:FimV/HubP family polar landmark protein n=1 Tax=Paraburkholderia flava TaxID=2547393 RepID=UPI0010603CD5|nr:FimV/HubP family polar landmark protein [Paraburkholderia flava]
MIVRQPGLLRPALRSRLYRWPAAATAAFLIVTGTCVAQGAPASAASAASVSSAVSATSAVGASEPVSAIGLPAAQYTVRAGESLNDVAIAVTQSHDRATLARAARALFDANPAAFMGHDPSRMKIGAVMNVPTLDASGAVVGASGAAGASAAGASSTSASQSAAASAPTGNASASAASVAASSAAGATAAQSASASVAQASSTPSSSSSSAADTTQAGSQPSVAPQDAHASGAHVWSGTIQQSASAPEAASAGAASVPAASQPRAQVSSLQQLLALKNRVLMELQKHGIGSTGQSKAGANGASTAAVASAASTSASGGAATGASTVPATQAGSGSSLTDGQFGFTQTQLGIGAVIGAALVVLLTGLSMRKRRPAKPAADAAKQTDAPARPATLLEKDAAAYAARLKEQEPEADEPASTVHDDGEHGKPAETLTAVAEHPTLDGATTAASLAAAAALGAEALPTQTIQPVDANQPHVDEPQPVDGAKEDAAPSLNDATTTASLGAATELGADALPPASLEADEERDTPSPAVEPTPAHVPVPFPRDAMVAFGSLDLSLPPRSGPAVDVPPLPATTHAEPEPTPDEPAPLVDTPTTPPPVEPHAAEHPVFGASTESHTAEQLTPAASSESHIDEQSAPTASTELHATEQPAPTASTESHVGEQPPLTASTESPAPEQLTPTPEPTHAAAETAAATTTTAAIAGLGAARFGALNLDFDLELPPSPAQPIPAFTAEELARIARNKLDLASEYIALGDLNGARTLINEVIAANDTGTRDEARALLSTLAPLS